MSRVDPEDQDRCHHGHPPDECPLCSDEELTYPSFEPLDLLLVRDAENAVVPADLVGVPFN